MKPRNFRRWINALRTTPEASHARGALVKEDIVDIDGELNIVRQMCAMGLVCNLAGLEVRPLNDGRSLSFDGALATPPNKALRWLGLSHKHHDVVIDWPKNLRDPMGDRYHLSMELGTVVGLNDFARLTFDQIADVIEYAGVVEQ